MDPKMGLMMGKGSKIDYKTKWEGVNPPRNGKKRRKKEGQPLKNRR